MVKFKKGLLVITLVSLIMLTIRPFSVEAAALSIYYDTDALRTEWQGKILGDYWQYTSTDNATDNDLYIYKFRFDKAYIGQIQFQVRFSGQSSWAFGSERVLVAGYESFDWYYREYTINNQNSRINAVNITFVNLTPLDDFGGDLASIISYLQSIDATEDDIYSILQSISSDTDKLTMLKQWHVPFESVSSMAYLVQNHEVYSFQNIYDYDFPVFNIKQNEILFQRLNYNYETYTWIFCFTGNINAVNNPDSSLDISKQFKFYDRSGNELSPVYSNFVQLDRSFTLNTTDGADPKAKILKVDFNLQSPHIQTVYLKYINSNTNNLYFPIYLNINTYKLISTDFALRFGLSNQLLDDLHIIAQGTSSSNNSASSLESSTSSFSSTASNVYNVEDQVSSGFNSSMQNIPSSFNFQNNFGSSFVVSASWVRDQFNNMTTNNPFGSLITFSLILGVALLIIGRLLS